jgi:hypothetical protein
MRMKAVFDCSADEPGELSFKEGDILVDVVESGEEGWYKGRIENTVETGLFPYNYVIEITDSPETIELNEKPEIPLNSTTTSVKPTWQAKSPTAAVLASYPALDAFEAAMSGTKVLSPKSSSPPVITALKPKLSTPKNDGIKVYAGTSTFEKPQLKSITQQKDSSPTRLRSYSASSVLSKTNADLDTEKTLRPSQLLNGKGTKSALELALSKGSPKPPSNLRSNSCSTKTNVTGIALVGMSKLNSNSSSSINTDVEDEDGYQMVKPSQLRQRLPTPKPISSQSALWKKSLLESKDVQSTSKLDVAPSNNPMPRLPSRPVSTASRKSRNSRNSTKASLIDITTKTNVLPVKEATTSEKASPPIIKPKPQISSATHPHLPPRPKARSSSNPPPIQPKPAMSSIEILMNRAASKEKSSTTHEIITTPSKSMTPPRAKKPAPPPPQSRTPTRSNMENWQTTTSPENGNIKPSSILRARSSTNPASMVSDWNQPLKPTPAVASRVIPVADTPAVVATVVEPRKKTTPPPPPPSRPPKSKTLTEPKQRYEILFDSIHDDGYVDGETAQVIWVKSKLSNEDLARIWRECDPDHKGLLDKHAFIDGMSKIDELLLSKQQQIVM